MEPGRARQLSPGDYAYDEGGFLPGSRLPVRIVAAHPNRYDEGVMYRVDVRMRRGLGGPHFVMRTWTSGAYVTPYTPDEEDLYLWLLAELGR